MTLLARTLIYFLLVFLLALGIQNYPAFATNDGQSGPHGGDLQGKGNFHTELRSLSNSGLVLYLLDGLHKNPTTDKSSVGVMLRGKDRDSGVECTKMDNHFDCETAQGISMDQGDEIIINATRNGVYGGTVVYRLPLRSSISYPMAKK